MALSTNAQNVIGGLAAGGLTALGDVFGKPSPEKVTTNSTTNATSTPTYSSAVLPLYNQLLSSYLQRANGNSADSAINSMQTQGQQQINQTANNGTSALRTILAQRGLQYSPAAATSLVQNELARQSNQVGFNNSLPQLRYQMETSDLGNAGQFFSSLPHGMTQNSTSNGTQTVETPQQSPVTGFLGGVASAIPSLLKMF